jgi:hypothetical protein
MEASQAQPEQVEDRVPDDYAESTGLNGEELKTEMDVEAQARRKAELLPPDDRPAAEPQPEGAAAGQPAGQADAPTPQGTGEQGGGFANEGQ